MLPSSPAAVINTHTKLTSSQAQIRYAFNNYFCEQVHEKKKHYFLIFLPVFILLYKAPCIQWFYVCFLFKCKM